ncbi:phosphotransferase [Nocardioides sp. dk4132]|uniref:phosphotransferase n=1 Tax=unclassified Nocardioides TaxID=2615069 RepID=UPI00129745FF|nr:MULTISPECIES: phosphotransferase [unclassified Nocardioides]MQW74708.1 phosphotransferase [Nocardioides sp. dk4132]QGA06612.1 phosphotransferase [Nocardioides sp. dk884]
MREWVEERLAERRLSIIGPVEQPHVMPWSTVLCFPTGAGPVWFKANDASLHHEAGLVALLAARFPDRVPPLLAADPGRGWMLMADAGTRLREVIPVERSLTRWYDVLETVARIQVGTLDAVEEMLALGVPDLRLPRLVERYDDLVRRLDVPARFRSATPYVAELVATLERHGVPAGLNHDDLHDGQVFLGTGRHLVLDWGDACLTHPFFVLSVALEGQVAWGVDDVEGSVDIAPFRDAYLAPWAEALPGTDLVAVTDAALRLGWAARAVNGHVAADPDDTERTLTRLQMFLDGRVAD